MAPDTPGREPEMWDTPPHQCFEYCRAGLRGLGPPFAGKVPRAFILYRNLIFPNKSQQFYFRFDRI